MLKRVLEMGKRIFNPATGAEFSYIQPDPAEINRFLEQVASHDGLLLVQFWAPGCQPCEMMKPAIEESLAQFPGQLTLITVDVEQNFSIALHYGLDCFPTLLLFQSGTIVERITGTVPAIVLIKVIAKHLPMSQS